jgi:toxin ParE1/3/4
VDFKVLLSDQALSDLSEIVEYIAGESPEAATEVGQSLIGHVKILQSFPYIGTPVPRRRKMRKLYHTPYNIYYRIHENRRVVEILHFWHGRRRNPKF